MTVVEAHPDGLPGNSIVNSLGMTLRLIPAGEFLMSSPEDDPAAEAREKPQHRARITRAFRLGATEVTHAQYRRVTGENPSHFQGSDDLPAENVTWLDAARYCNALSAREGLAPFYHIDSDSVSMPDRDRTGYRLPTEAEWEYACRAGAATRYSCGDDAARLGEHAWFEGNSDGKTHPVGQKLANGWGLFDMHGNVWELCWDRFDVEYYASSPARDPQGPRGGNVRSTRGGCFVVGAWRARSATRGWIDPSDRAKDLGFRVARSR